MQKLITIGVFTLYTFSLFAQTRATLFYPLDQTPSSGLNVLDATTHTTATIIREDTGLPAASSGAAAYSSQSWDFGGVDASVQVNANAVLETIGDINTTDGLSVGFWLNHTYNSDANLRLAGMGNVLDFLTGQSSGIGTMQLRFAGETYQITTQSSDDILDGNWHHLVVTLDFTTTTDNLKLYIDGNLAYTQSENVSSSFAETGQTLKIGARSNTSNAFPGKLDEFILFTKAINSTEVTTLYQNGGYAFSNLAPMVDLGKDTIINPNDLPFNMAATVTDDGLPNPPVNLTMNWAKLSGAGNVTFSPNNNATTSINFDQEDTYELELTVTDGDFTVKDTIQVTLGNMPPTVAAGADQIITLPNNSVNLNGSTNDSDNYPNALINTWEKVSGTGSIVFGDVNVPITTAAFSTAGNYLLRLGADDGAITTYDTIKIVVNAVSESGGYTYAWEDYDPATFGNDNLVQDFTGVRAIPHAPAAGIHPRIFFGPDEFTDLKNRIQNTTSGQQVFAQMHAYTTLLHLSYNPGGYNHNSSYGKDAAGESRIDNAGKWNSHDIYYKLIAEDPTALDGVDNKRRYLLASVMALEAFECYVMAGETDNDTGMSYNDRSADLAKAMAYWSDLVIDDVNLYPDNYHYFGGIHMATCYDLNFNSMTSAQQDKVRAALAKLIWDYPIYGTSTEYYSTTSNWIGLNSFQIIMNFAIEGETGYKPELTERYMRAYRNFLNHGWYDSGAGFEGLGKNYQMVTSLVAAAKRGYSLLGHPKLKAYGNNFLPAITQPYGYAFTGTDVWGGSGWDTKTGGYKFNASDVLGLKWAFPEDEAVDFVWRNYIGGQYNLSSTGYVYQTMSPATSGYHNYLVLAGIFADDYDEATDWETHNENALESKSFLAPERGLAILRSGYTKDDLMLHFHVRQDFGGHTHGDRNNVALSGLGRIWLRYTYGSAFQETEYHSTVLINDLGIKITNRDGRKARQPARLMDFQENGNMATASGDATYAYSWEWEWQGRDANTDHSWLGTDNWEKVTETWNDFRYQAGNKYFHELPFYDFAQWQNGGQLERMIKRPYNPMQRVYRTVAMFRDCQPFVIIADDIQKNEEAQNYKSLLQTANDLTITQTDVNLQADNYRNDIILSEADGNRNLLVRVLNKGDNQCVADLVTGTLAFSGETRAVQTITSNAAIATNDSVQFIAGNSITLEEGFSVAAGSDFLAKISPTACETNPAYMETVTPGINGNSPITRLVIESTEIAAAYKILLFPFEDGTDLPITKWNPEKDELTVICEGTEQKIAFTEVDGSTKIAVIPATPLVEEPSTTAKIYPIKKEEILSTNLMISPQPFKEQFTVRYETEASQLVTVHVLNSLGQSIFTQSWSVENGLNQLIIPSDDWVAGQYFLQISSGNEGKETKLLIKQN